jgi:hypothetical protein
MREEQVAINRSHSELQMFQMQTLICIMLLLPSGTKSSGLEKVLRLAELVADIYQHLERGCIFLMNSHALQEGEIQCDNILCEQ